MRELVGWRDGWSPFSLACWLSTLDKSWTSVSRAVQKVWEVYLETLRLVLPGVRESLHRFCHLEPDIDCACDTWCRAAEGFLLSA